MDEAKSFHRLTSYLYYTESRQKIKHNHTLRCIFWYERVMHLLSYRIYLSGYTPALAFAAKELTAQGLCPVSDPASATHLLLPVPTFDTDGTIRGGGRLERLLEQLPKDVLIMGGNLDRPELSDYRTFDLLKDPFYTAQNAHITACCALKLTMQKLPVILTGQPVLVIGWGRIGKCLAQLLRQLGAHVTVAARKEADRAALTSLGYRAIDTKNIDPLPYRVIYNTTPTMVLPQCPGNALKIDLASRLGIGGLDVVWARGLPGRDAPESSGQLIARTVLRYLDQGGKL